MSSRRRTFPSIVPVLEQDRLDMGVTAQDRHQFRPAIASKADNSYGCPHWLNIHLHE